MIWFVLALLVFIAELFSGTFYLLVVSAALACAGLADWLLGTSVSTNLVITAILSLIGIAIVKKYHTRFKPAAEVSAHRNDLDLGQTVQISAVLPHGELDVHYRGTQWQAKSTDDTAASPGQSATIVGRNGNVLLVQINRP